MARKDQKEFDKTPEGLARKARLNAKKRARYNAEKPSELVCALSVQSALCSWGNRRSNFESTL